MVTAVGIGPPHFCATCGCAYHDEEKAARCRAGPPPKPRLFGKGDIAWSPEENENVTVSGSRLFSMEYDNGTLWHERGYDVQGIESGTNMMLLEKNLEKPRNADADHQDFGTW